MTKEVIVQGKGEHTVVSLLKLGLGGNVGHGGQGAAVRRLLARGVGVGRLVLKDLGGRGVEGADGISVLEVGGGRKSDGKRCFEHFGMGRNEDEYR